MASNMAKVLLTNDDSFDNDDHAHLGARKRGPGQGRPGSPAATYFRLVLRNNNYNHQAKYSWSMLVYAGLMCSNMFQ